jgi:PST family polysaccharide transporter
MKSNVFYLFLLQIVNYIVPILTIPYLTNTLGLAKYGMVVMVFSIIQISFVITDFGFGLSATYRISLLQNEDKKKVSEIIGSVFFIKIILIILITIIIYFYANFSDFEKNKEYLYVALLAIVGQAFQPMWFFQGIEKMKAITNYSVLIKVFYALFIFLFVVKESDSLNVIYAWSFAQIIGALLSFYFIYKEGYWITLGSRKLVKELFFDSAHFFWSRAAVSLYTSASTFIIGAVGGSTQAALYSICEQIYKVGQSLVTPINQVMFPHMAKNKDWMLFFKIVVTISLLFIITISISYFYTADMLDFVFGKNYREASPILRVFLFISLINYIAVSFGYPAFSALNKLKYVNVTVILASTFYGIYLLFLYSENQVNGINVAYGILFTELFVMVSRLVGFFYYKRIN